MNARLLRLPRLIPRLQRSAPAARIHTTPPRPAPRIVPHIQTCPSPSCACGPQPELEIDRTGNLRGAFVPYKEQVLVCSGRDDWTSRIEDEEGVLGGVVGGLKGVLGRGGEFCDPYHNVSILTSSFPSPTQDPALLLLPSFKYIPSAPPHKPTLSALTKAHLLPRKLHPMHDALSAEDKRRLTRDPSVPGAPAAVEVKDVVVLICGHGGRDVRCGVMGPLLRGKFREVLDSDNIPVTEEPPTEGDEGGKARVGLISHIGGHKFAGNVIIYVPPGMEGPDGGKHPLAGCAVWYGRVDETHVEGIVGATVRRGEIIGELFRGGIDSEGRMLDIGK